MNKNFKTKKITTKSSRKGKRKAVASSDSTEEYSGYAIHKAIARKGDVSSSQSAKFLPASTYSWGDMIEPSKTSGGSSSSMLQGGKKTIKPNTTGKGPNAQNTKGRKRGKKGQRKVASGSSQREEARLTKEARDEVELRLLMDRIRQSLEEAHIEDEVRDEFPGLQAIRVEVGANFAKLLRVAAEYSLFAMAKRAMGPEAVVILPGGTRVGKLWLAWITIAYDLWTNAMSNQKSLFVEAHPHYRRLFNFLTYKQVDNHLFTWLPTQDYLTAINPPPLGPTSTCGLAWELSGGPDDPLTGQRLLTNTMPTVTLDMILKFGASVTSEIFSLCLNKKMKLCSMGKIPKYQQNLSPAAFARTESDNNPDFPLSITVELEVPINRADLDIAELQLAISDSRRTCPHKEGSIAGTLSNFTKLVRPEEFKTWLRPLPKEIPITSIANAYLAPMVLADKMVRENLDPGVITQDPQSIFTQLSSGMIITAVLLEACQKFLIGNAMMSVNETLSGSLPVGGDTRSYVPITTYNNVSPTALREALSEFSIHLAPPNAITTVASMGKEIYIPFVSARGERFAANPVATSDTDDYNDYMTLLFPYASVVSGHTFATFPAPSIPNYVDLLTTDKMYFVGATPTAAINQINAMSALIQAAVGLSSYTDVNTCKTTVMLFSTILEDIDVTTWDLTQSAIIYQVSNRFPLSSQVLGTLPNLTPVFYAGDNKTAAGFLTWYAEYSTILAEDVTQYDMLTRWFRMFSHQRASRGGWGPDEYYIGKSLQNAGGGFIGGLVAAASGALRGVQNYFGGGIQQGGDHLEMRGHVAEVLEEIAGNPGRYKHGPYAVMKLQSNGGLARFFE